MIVVVGNLLARRSEQGITAAGAAATIGRVAAASGAEVQLVGKVGEGPDGDAVLISLNHSSVGHVAVLRDTAAVPFVDAVADDDPELGSLVEADIAQPTPDLAGFGARPTLDSGDLQLALRYLPDYRVVVVVDPLDEPGLATVAAAARWAGAQLIVVVPADTSPARLTEDATVLESPPSDPDGTFATVVGAYAAALDRGASPAEAFASASVQSGWAAVAD